MPRLFIAIEFPTEILAQLREIQSRLRRLTSGGRFPLEKNLHLTLQFLGDVDERKVPGIIASLHQGTCQNPSFSLRLGEPGVFGEKNPYRVAWLGLAGELSVLQQLQRDIARSMAGLGFISEHKIYRPHITLARDVVFSRTDGQVWSYEQNGKQTFTVQHFSLIASLLQEGKRVYRTVQHFYL
jgi:2'-5' RNA ligase